MENTVYKLCRVKKDGKLTSLTSSTDSAIELEYTMGKERTHDMPLFVFKTFDDTMDYLSGYFDVVIVEGTTTSEPLALQGKPVLCLPFRSIEDVRAFWHAWLSGKPLINDIDKWGTFTLDCPAFAVWNFTPKKILYYRGYPDYAISESGLSIIPVPNFWDTGEE